MIPYIVVLHSVKKANSCNKYAICRACISAVGKDEAYKNKFTNTKRECVRYFQSCPNFAKKYTAQEIKDLLDKAERDGAKSTSKKKNIKPPKKRSRKTDISDDSSSENESNASYHSIADGFSNNEISQDPNTLDNYIFHPLTSA